MSLILSAVTLQTVFIYSKPFTLLAKGGSTNVLEMGWVSVLGVRAQIYNYSWYFPFNCEKMLLQKQWLTS